jgi:hypothetical protein
MNPRPFTDFHKEEYQSLRKEIEASVREARDLEKYALLATAAVWTWLAAKGRHVTNPQFNWIPAVIVILAIVRSVALLLSIRKIAAYIQTVEAEFACHPPKGWETFVGNPRDHSIWMSSAVFWLCLLIATCLVPRLILNLTLN